MIGTVTVVKCESLAVDRLWEMSRQGRQAKVSRSQFETYYANQESGVGLWVGAAILFPTPISHAGQLRQNWGQRWQPPQQIQRLSDDQISALAITKRYS